MIKLHLPKFRIPFINTTKLLVVLAVAIVLATVAYGMVRAEQAKAAQDKAVAAQKAAEQARRDAETKAFAKVQSELDIQTAKATTACGLLNQYSIAKATSKLVHYPPVCSIK